MPGFSNDFSKRMQLLKKMNLLLLFLVYASIGYGIIFIYGTGQQTGGSFSGFWIKQLIWMSIGTVIMLKIASMDYVMLGKYSWLVYLITVFLLVAVLLIGSRINGAKSWLRIIPGVTIQPSEFAKLGLIISLSWHASRPSVKFKYITEVIPSLCLTLVPVVLILLQPDHGSASILLPIALAILFISGIKKKWILYGMIFTLAMSPFIYKHGLKEHQKKRLEIFLSPSKNATNEGWNARQSLLAVGSGGLSGKGYMKGTQNVLGFLPRKVAPTDFIFSVIAEETGFIGSSLLILIFCTIILTALYISIKASDNFGRNLACGIAILLCVHVYINIGMTMGMAPIIGIPLPFVSYGGSFMILMLSCVGILQSVYIKKRTY